MKATTPLCVLLTVAIASSATALETSDSAAAWLAATPQERIAVAAAIAKQLNPQIDVTKADVRFYMNCLSDLATYVDPTEPLTHIAKACTRAEGEGG